MASLLSNNVPASPETFTGACKICLRGSAHGAIVYLDVADADAPTEFDQVGVFHDSCTKLLDLPGDYVLRARIENVSTLTSMNMTASQ